MIDGSTGARTLIGLPHGSVPMALDVNSVNNLAFTANLDSDNSVGRCRADSAALQFYALPPCRLVDTRQNDMPIMGGTSQSFLLPQLNNCIPPGVGAAAYSSECHRGSASAAGLSTIWPTGEDQPLVSTMNSPDGRAKANAAIVPAGYQGAGSVFASDTTDVILDINGYFALPGSGNQFYPLTPAAS